MRNSFRIIGLAFSGLLGIPGLVSISVAGASTAVIVPLNRVPPMSAGNSVGPWNPGVPGGIPSYSYCNSVTNFGAIGDGITDDSAAFAKALAACTNGGYVWVPAGRYRCGSTITMQKPQQVVLRGAGPSRTVIESYTTTDRAPIVISTGTLGATRHSVLSGFTRGSTILNVDNASDLTVGMVAKISQDNDPAQIMGLIEGIDESRQSQIFTITGISGNQVRIDRPLYYNYSSVLHPILEGCPNFTMRCGIEDLMVVCNSQPQGDGFGVFLFLAKQCWIKNCIVSNAPHANIVVQYSLQCEVRDSATYNHQAYDSNARYGIQVGLYTSDSLIENNIVQGNNLAIVLQQAAVGNVIGYNFSDRGYGDGYPTDLTLRYGVSLHGSNPNLNLIEGNVVQNLAIDDFWGSNPKNTFLRNWATHFNYNNPDNAVAIYGVAPGFVAATNYFNSFVGNILYQPRDINGIAWDFGHSPERNGNASPAPPYDPNVAPTTFLHGNSDFVTGTTQWLSGVSLSIPQSYYLPSKPVWFGNLTWPAIGPDVNTTSTITNTPVIPAQARSLGVSY